MKRVALALGISTGVGAILFAIVYSVVRDAHIAEGFGALPFVGCHGIFEMLERSETRTQVAAHGTASIRPLRGFAISWPIVVLYGALAMCAIDLFAGVFGAATIAIVDDNDDLARTFAVLVAAAPIELIGGFMVGQWIGSRYDGWSRATVLLVALLGALLSNGLGAVANASAGGNLELANTWMTDTFAFASITLIQLAAAGLVGHWRGRKHRLSAYIDYLLSVLPSDTRSTLVELAYEEAVRPTGRSN
jgi:hypothetical protein